ncbi:MAG TPA: chemotaxis protein CheC [Clostridiaceae bacterium]|jgi:chemotaxis protein CheC|nr:chemotaxis protein CheC [Clostridiaceae bacterium]
MSGNFNSFSNFNDMHLDILKEIGNIGSGNAITALAKMLNKKIDMEVPKVKILKFSEVTEILGCAENPVVGVMLAIEGDMTGCILFLLDLSAARALVNMLMGMDNKAMADNAEFSEIEVSALKETGNILASSYLSALSELTGIKVYPSVPDISIDMAGAILSVPAIEFGKLGETVLYIETEFSEGCTRVVGDFFLVPDIESYGVLMRALGVIW